MGEIAEKIFFRYKSGDYKNYSEETLLRIADETMKYGEALESYPTSYIEFLLDLPEHIFCFYLMRVGRDINNALYTSGIMLDEIFESDEVLERRRGLPRNKHIHNELFKLINNSNYVSGFSQAGGNVFIISLLKKSNRYNHTQDLLLFIHNGEVKTRDLSPEYKNKEYYKNLKLFTKELHDFQEKNRLYLLFT